MLVPSTPIERVSERERWARRIESLQPGEFDMQSLLRCAMHHALKSGVLTKRRSRPAPSECWLNTPDCPCPQCCSYESMARRTGISAGILRDIFVGERTKAWSALSTEGVSREIRALA